MFYLTVNYPKRTHPYFNTFPSNWAQLSLYISMNSVFWGNHISGGKCDAFFIFVCFGWFSGGIWDSGGSPQETAWIKTAVHILEKSPELTSSLQKQCVSTCVSHNYIVFYDKKINKNQPSSLEMCGLCQNLDVFLTKRGGWLMKSASSVRTKHYTKMKYSHVIGREIEKQFKREVREIHGGGGREQDTRFWRTRFWRWEWKKLTRREYSVLSASCGIIHAVMFFNVLFFRFLNVPEYKIVNNRSSLSAISPSSFCNQAKLLMSLFNNYWLLENMNNKL